MIMILLRDREVRDIGSNEKVNTRSNVLACSTVPKTYDKQLYKRKINTLNREIQGWATIVGVPHEFIKNVQSFQSYSQSVYTLNGEFSKMMQRKCVTVYSKWCRKQNDINFYGCAYDVKFECVLTY